jgi:hypothetical protein
MAVIGGAEGEEESINMKKIEDVSPRKGPGL